MRVEKSVNEADSSAFTAIRDLYTLTRIWNEYNLENRNVHKFIHSTGLHFDVVISEEFFNDSFLMFAHKFKAPIITICKFCLICNSLLSKLKGTILQLASFDVASKLCGLITRHKYTRLLPMCCCILLLLLHLNDFNRYNALSYERVIPNPEK